VGFFLLVAALAAWRWCWLLLLLLLLLLRTTMSSGLFRKEMEGP
jgi:hypothetical protein